LFDQLNDQIQAVSARVLCAGRENERKSDLADVKKSDLLSGADHAGLKKRSGVWCAAAAEELLR
jgi:hypothetical protein